MRALPVFRVGLLLVVAIATPPALGDELKDLYFGEALYYAHQGDFFAALERLDTEVKQHDDLDEPERDSLFFHIDDAEFSLGDFELRYRMHHRAGRAITAVLEGAVDELVRNDAAYRLARIHFQKDQIDDALRALDRIDGRVPDAIRHDIRFLRANIYLRQQRNDEAIELLRELEADDGFAAYNLGIAYLQAGQYAAGLEQLDKAGVAATDDPALASIRDKSNLVLGTLLFDEGDFAAARPILNRVRVEGPFSNRALLRAGWASASTETFERAVVPWKILSEREVTDAATQEAMLALPYAYGKLNVHGRAAVHYGKALDAFGAEVDKLNASIESIRAGRFLDALIREEIRKDTDWVIRLRDLPETPETYYLMELLATHSFQAGLQNFLDLADLHRKLDAWQASFDAFDEMVGIRQQHYEPLLPEIDQEFRELDSRMRLRIEQHKLLVQRLKDMLTTPRPEFLATREEQALMALIERVESRLLERHDGTPPEHLVARIQRLKGVIAYTLHVEYHERLTEFDRNLSSLNDAMAVLDAKYEQFVRGRQAASHSYEGHPKPISNLRARVAIATDTVARLMARQGELLEIVAINELVVRRERLENYRDKARFALADSYDRATQSRAREGGTP